ncbi:MAG: FAD binding domain-containing protein [Xanthomonadales bacterium]|nr:FAD binding domain-containing protein [Xanthomonadales bacterium]
MEHWKHYHAPASVEEAVALLDRYSGVARVMGGGTDLLLDISQGRCPAPEAMVDPTRIEGLTGITRADGYIVIGCGATHTMITQNEDIVRHGSCLAESCGVIGGPQVRNVATLAGNIAHAMPAGDGTIGLLALDGEVETADNTGRCWTPLADVFLGPGLSAIDPYCTLLTRLRFKPTGPLCGSAFYRVMRPQGVALPMISMAACLQLDGQHDIVAARISIGPAGPIPHLAIKAMEFLVSGPATSERFEEATEVALGKLTLRDSKYRASREYREEMVRTHLPRVLARATQRAVDGNGERAQ